MTLRKISIGLLWVVLIGLCLLLYPSLADYWNAQNQSHAVSSYDALAERLSASEDETELEKAKMYNAQLAKLSYPLGQYDKVSGYEDCLNLAGTGMMGYLSIPKLRIQLPIYHGTSDEVLASNAGHLEGTSLPVGGAGTHAVISAHRGLPSASLFTSLDKMEIGDTFTIRVLDKTLTYQVDQIKVVTPDQTSDLAIDPNADYVTLLTCTPYMVNSHRLLVRGRRVEGMDITTYINSEAYRIDNVLAAAVMAIPILLILILIVCFKPARGKAEEDL